MFRRRFGVSLAYVPRGPVVDWADEEADVIVQLPVPAARLKDFWTGDDSGVQRGTATLRRLPPHASRVFTLESLED